MTRFALVFALTVCASCRTSEGPDPKDVPRRHALPTGAVPVLIVSFEATDAGYQLIDTRRGMGAPNLTIDQHRDVLITALGANRKHLASVTLFNPRVGHTTGADNPQRIILRRGTLTVRFADPDEIESVEVAVRRGPNSNYRERFSVTGGTP